VPARSARKRLTIQRHGRPEPAERLSRLRQRFLHAGRIGIGGAQALQHIPSGLIAIQRVEGARAKEAGIRLGGIEKARTGKRLGREWVTRPRGLGGAERLPPMGVVGLGHHGTTQRRGGLAVTMCSKGLRARSEVARPRRRRLQHRCQQHDQHALLYRERVESEERKVKRKN